MKNSRVIEASVAPTSYKTIKRRADPESDGHDGGPALKAQARPLGGKGQHAHLSQQPSRRPMHDPDNDGGYDDEKEDDDASHGDKDMEELGSEPSGSGQDADSDKERNLQEQVGFQALLQALSHFRWPSSMHHYSFINKFP